MDIETSRESATFYGDVTTCSECGGVLTWSQFTDGTWSYVDGWDSATCQAGGVSYRHEPVLNLPEA